ncbi:hypothetical protein [Sphingopyxis sp.]|uniref:hypothetical protein n=1 Tax=Sphingopyxis sp. TaxID=1908224 RepID=UPI0014858730|nr:hypothetical protein [Sphingopyxis sp.]MBR2174741.1 hypothetical protein [Sphingopyxis sp.]
MRLWLAIFFLLLAPPAHAQKQIALSFDDAPRHAGAFFTPDLATAAFREKVLGESPEK